MNCMKITNEGAYNEAKHYIPGGVNSPVRAFKAVGGTPPFMKRGEGGWIFDIEDKKYIDFVMSYGPLILGHAHPVILNAAAEYIAGGTSFGAPTQAEVTLARMICEAVSSVERVRLVNSGTEATMTAVRLARAFTGRNKILKFEGCYHGHADSFLIQAGSGAMTLSTPGSPGVPATISGETLVAAYNDATSVAALLDAHGSDCACIIVEPVAGNMGVVLPDDGFLTSLRELADRHGALLIFDEVMTGFRIGYGGVQEQYGVTPDLTTFGKIIGGGFPIGALGGRSDIMDLLSPVGDVYQAGTLSGNPVAVGAGIATLSYLKQNNPYESLGRKTDRIRSIILEKADKYGVPVTVNCIGSMSTCFFTGGPVRTYHDAAASDTKKYAIYHQHMLDQGIFLAPSQFEAMFVSTAHSDGDLDCFAECVDNSFELFTHMKE